MTIKNKVITPRTYITKRYQSSKLISSPFSIKNTRKIRESNESFPTPSFISFDLFGTLYYPKKPVPEQYYDISHGEYGLNKSIESIEKEFPVVYDKLLDKWPNCGKHVLNDCEKWWEKLILKLYNLSENDPQAIKMSDRLINHFTSSDAYAVYADVIPTLEKLKQHNIKLIATSNSDLRVMKILDSLNLMKFFKHGAVKDIYLSYNLDNLKPEKLFFDKIALKNYQQEIQNKDDESIPYSYLEKCWHIGDNYNQDFLGAVKAGWNGIFINRDSKIKDKFEIIANNRVMITDLRQLLEIFELNE
ncbi:unnamed protein product [Candida verbasci]|uniref:Uncharacterized protein n=1 Tax=Candida verbasci TaxID=1227364 RepID=A0A9W4TUG4_9ASCO|nr:unnamed protein product [Candida verbasci]